MLRYQREHEKCRVPKIVKHIGAPKEKKKGSGGGLGARAECGLEEVFRISKDPRTRYLDISAPRTEEGRGRVD